MAWLTLLNVGWVGADDFSATNHMPASVRVLMEKAGYGMVQTNTATVSSDPDSLRQLTPLKKSQLRPLERPIPKSGWSFWNGVGVKYVHHNHDPMNALAPASLTPYSALSQFEYDVTYSFDF